MSERLRTVADLGDEPAVWRFLGRMFRRASALNTEVRNERGHWVGGLWFATTELLESGRITPSLYARMRERLVAASGRMAWTHGSRSNFAYEVARAIDPESPVSSSLPKQDANQDVRSQP